MQLLRIPERWLLLVHRTGHGKRWRGMVKCQLRRLGVPHFRLFIRTSRIRVHLRWRGRLHHRGPHGALFRAVLGTGELVPWTLLLPARHPPCAGSAALPCRSRTGSTAATWHCSTAGTAPLHTVPQAAWTSAHFHDAHARGQWREDLAPAHFRAPSRQSNRSPERLGSLSKTLRSPCLTHHGRASASKRRSEEQRRLHHANAASCGRLKLK